WQSDFVHMAVPAHAREAADASIHDLQVEAVLGERKALDDSLTLRHDLFGIAHRRRVNRGAQNPTAWSALIGQQVDDLVIDLRCGDFILEAGDRGPMSFTRD